MAPWTAFLNPIIVFDFTIDNSGIYNGHETKLSSCAGF